MKRSIFMCPIEIAGTMLDMHKAFDELGYKSKFLAFYDYPFGNPDDYKARDLNFYFLCVKNFRRNCDNGRMLFARLWQIPEAFAVLWIFVKAILNYDTFVYMYTMSMFGTTHYLKKAQELEFAILKLFRKRIIFWCAGSDTRPEYCSGSYPADTPDNLYKDTVEKRKRIRMVEKYGIMVDNLPSSHLHRKKYINSLAIGQSAYSKSYKENKVQKTDTDRPVIVHAPSRLDAKGTPVIREAIGNIKSKGYDIEYIELHSVSNEDVLRTLQRADIAIDQMYSDTPSAKFATEASSYAVPVIVGSHIADKLKKGYGFSMPPTVVCKPEELEQKLEYLIVHPEERKAIGEKERDFMTSEWNPQAVAKRFIRVVDGDIPNSWIVDPYREGSVWGWGGTKEYVVQRVVSVIERYGMRGLCLSPRQKLYKEYLELYRNYTSGSKLGEG